MRHLNLFLLSLLVLLTGCDVISPFIGDDLKIAICDRDNDGLPRSTEYCGGNDCDDTDANVGEPTGWFRDVDTDTFGAGEETFSCTQPEGFVDLGGDCDDTDQLVNPDAMEVCNGYDDDCDGGVDDENIPTWYADVDEDTYGDPAVLLEQCAEPDGYVDNSLDCNDGDIAINPDGTEICDDGIDQDCNDIVDDAEGAQAWYADVDGDGYGNEDQLLFSCQESVDGFVLDNQDCNDVNYDTSPAAFEACGDGIDNDCDGEIDTDAEDVPWYRDADEDGWGDPALTVTDCAPPSGYVGNAEDCDDTDAAVNPGISEVCNNGIDDNCDDSLNECIFSGDLSVTAAILTLDGTTEQALTGTIIAPACDVNGNGLGDLVVTAPGDSTQGVQAGAVFVFFDTSLSSTSTSLDVSNADVQIFGDQAGDETGSALACGDVNNDGWDDLLIGTPGNDDLAPDQGSVSLIYFPSAAILGLSEADATWADPNDQIGSVLNLGDLNGDGAFDLIIGLPNNDDAASEAGAVSLIWGGTHAGTHSLYESEAARWTGELTGDQAGSHLASCDVNGDGYEDLLLSAVENDDGGTGAGKVYLLYGADTITSESLSYADASWYGQTSMDRIGTTLNCSGDLDDDGLKDILISTAARDDTFTDAGVIYVIYGGTHADRRNIQYADAYFVGEAENDMAGDGLTLCDLNNDESEDLLIGAGNHGSGTIYLFDGGSRYSGGISLSTYNALWSGEAEGDLAGSILTCANDPNNDGIDDLFIGAPYADNLDINAGRVYLISGLDL